MMLSRAGTCLRGAHELSRAVGKSKNMRGATSNPRPFKEEWLP